MPLRENGFVNSSRETATEIVARLQSAGFAAFWAGGGVREGFFFSAAGF
jgi:hypothetical protein